MTEREIFIAALHEKDPAARAALLDNACVDDPALRERIEQLLREQEQLGSFLENPAEAGPDTGPATRTPTADIQSPFEGPGSVIGPYKLIHEIGEGGMGTVYMAQQTEPVKRTVALKLIKLGMDSKQVLARFEAERQALALMDHPNIAKVLDAGTTGAVASGQWSVAREEEEGSARLATSHWPLATAGRPYFVMELVKGIPITKFCDQHRLTPRQRLELFVPVCHAIQHAHQKGIIHRDIKPSNVLVALYDDRPMPKVIDFGVAKAAGQPLTEQTLNTAFGSVVGTLEYMSPEQASFNQLDIDTRSDIYSLGVLLYELLAGSPPFSRKDLEHVGMMEMLRVIREQEPSKPSMKLSTAEGLPTLAANRGTEPTKLAKLMRGELDWIVMKALDKDRNRRYETANGLAMDLQRYLADEPVQACPPSAGYRLRKLARRHKGMLTAVAAILALLATGTGISTWQAVRATLAERATGDALIQVTDEQAKTQAALAAESAAKTQAREALDSLTEYVVERLFAKLPEPDELEQAFLRRVLELYEAFTRQVGEPAEAQYLRVKAFFEVAFLRALLGDRIRAEADYRQAIKMLDQLAEASPEVVEYREKLARAHGNLGILLAQMDKGAAAEAPLRRARQLWEVLASESPRNVDYRRKLAAARNDVAVLLQKQKKNPQAEDAHRQAYDLYVKLAAEPEAGAEDREALARSRTNLAGFLREQQKYAEAEDLYRQAVEAQKSLLASLPPLPKFRRHLGESYHAQAILFAEQKKTTEAKRAFGQALVLQKKLVDDFPRVRLYRETLAIIYSDLGNLLRAPGQTEEGESAWRSARDLWEQLTTASPEVPDYHNQLARTLGRLSGLRFQRREFADAVALLEQARPHNLAALKDQPKNKEYRRFYHMTLTTLAQSHFELAANHVVLAEAADDLVQFDYEPANDAYNAAVCLSRCIQLVDRDNRLDEARRKELTNKYADRALALLRHAVEHGFKDTAKIKEHPCFAPLRERKEFKQLLADLERKTGE